MSELRRICILHFGVAMLLSGVQRMLGRAVLPFALLSLCNAVCLIERFWAVQRRSMGLWSVATQLCFLLSRAVLALSVVTLAGCFLALLHWDYFAAGRQLPHVG